MFKKAFGTPSYPSPLDRIRTGRKDRASQLGVQQANHASFEGNQSFPKASKSRRKEEITEPPDEPIITPDLDKSLDKSLKDFHGKYHDCLPLC